MIHSYLAHTHTHTTSKLLHAIQIESDYYIMKSDHDKRISLTINQHKSSVKYLDGVVPKKHEAVYLGSLLTDTLTITGKQLTI